MNTLEHLIAGFGVALSPLNLLIAALGSFIGTVVGLLPGLGPINGVAILMPLAFAMSDSYNAVISCIGAGGIAHLVCCTLHVVCCMSRRHKCSVQRCDDQQARSCRAASAEAAHRGRMPASRAGI